MRRIFHGLLVGLLVGTLAYPAEAIQWGAGTGTSYPTTLDTANNRTNVGGAACSSAVTTNICKEWLNDWQGAVIAIMTELGTLPKGSYADVKARLNAGVYIGTAGTTLTPDAGGLVYSTSSALAVQAAGTSGYFARSGGTGAPTWFDLFGTANTFTVNQTISSTAPSFVLTDTTASAKSLTIAVDANLAQFRESAGASGSLLVLDLANNRVSIGTTDYSLGGTQLYSRFTVHGTDNTALYNVMASNAGTGGTGVAISRAGGSINTWYLYIPSGTTGFRMYNSNQGVGAPTFAQTELGLTGLGGNTSPDRLFHPELTDAVTAATSYVQRISHITSGTAAVGFGAGLEWELENASGTNRVVGTIETLYTDATDATEDADFVVKLMAAGAAAAEKLRVDSTGLLITQNATLMKSGVTLTDGAGVGVGTLTNAPAAGNPTKWLAINDNGTVRYVPAW